MLIYYLNTKTNTNKFLYNLTFYNCSSLINLIKLLKSLYYYYHKINDESKDFNITKIKRTLKSYLKY